MATAASLQVRIGADASGLRRGLKRARGAVERTSRKMQRAGRAMTQAISAPIALAGGAAVKAFSDYEDAMVEVQKVTDKTTADALRDNIKQMSEEIPFAAKELANLAADAGRFGVEGPQNIQAFTESVAKMATATDLSTDQAGEAFAKLSTLTNTPISDVENLGSSVNALSNEMATSSSEITQAMLKSAGALGNLGASQTQIAALNAAINEVSESSRRAGTRLRSLIQETMDPRKVQDLASAMGMNANAFTRMRSESPVQMIERMAQAMKEGGPAADRLRSALGSTSRQALAGLSQNLGGVTQALQTSRQEFERNTSLQKEFDAATGTLSSKLSTLKNRVVNIGIAIGSQLAPFIERAIRAVSRVTEWFESLSDRMKRVITISGLLAAAIGPVLVVLGSLGAAIASISAPVAGAIAALGSLVAAGVKWRDNLTSVFQSVVDEVQDIFGTWWGQAIIDVVKYAWNTINDYVRTAGKTLLEIIDGITDLLTGDFGGAWESVQSMIATSLGFLKRQMKRFFKWFVKQTANLLQALPWVGDDSAKQMRSWADSITTSMDETATSFDNATESAMNFAKALGGFAGGGKKGSQDQTDQDQESQSVDAEKAQTAQEIGITSIADKVPKAIDGISRLTEKVQELKTELADSSGVDSFKNAIDRLNESTERQAQSAFIASKRAAKQASSFQEGAKAAVNAARKQFKAALMRGVAETVASALTNVPFPFNIAAAASAGAAAEGLFSTVVPKFAEGGLVTGGMIAEIGEGPRTSKSNPEVVAPLDKLKAMLPEQGGGSQGGELTARLSLDEIIFALDQRRQHNAA